MSLVTIMTPTYNRGYIIGALYESLKKQSCSNFEWIVVDDGSTDGTEQFFEGIKDETVKFDISYYKKENGGKHTAINYALDLAKGDYFFIVDSDDVLPEDSVETIIKWFKTIDNELGYAGVGGLKINLSGTEMFGTTFEGDFLDCTYIDREINNISGEKAEVYYTSLLKKYKFPVFDKERFLSEAIVWYAIAEDGYKIRWFNEGIYKCEYREDGLTKNLFQHYEKSPKGFALLLKCIIKYARISKFKKIYYYGFYQDITHSSIKSTAEEFQCNKFVCLLGMFINIVKKIVKR